MASNVPAPDEPVGDETGSSTGDDTKDRPDSDGSSTMESFDEAARAYDKAFAGTAAGEKIRGTNAADRIDGHGGNDTLVGRGGDDALYGGLGDDKLLGGTGSDFLDGSKGADKLYGDFGIDKLYGDAGDDLLKGGDGDDWISSFRVDRRGRSRAPGRVPHRTPMPVCTTGALPEIEAVIAKHPPSGALHVAHVTGASNT